MLEENVTLLFDAPQIEARVTAMAEHIAADVPTDVVVVGLLKGCFVFVADLARALSRVGLVPRIEFLTLSSYGKGRVSSGHIELKSNVPADLAGKTVLIVDDVADTGRSLSFAKELIASQGASAVRCCALIDKPSKREVAVGLDYVGFTVGDEFVVGYGIDFAGRYRNLPFIGVCK